MGACVLVSTLSFCRLVSEREMRRQKTLDKIHSIKNQMKEMDDSDWSVPWLLVGFIAVLGYCVYYVLR